MSTSSEQAPRIGAALDTHLAASHGPSTEGVVSDCPECDRLNGYLTAALFGSDPVNPFREGDIADHLSLTLDPRRVIGTDVDTITLGLPGGGGVVVDWIAYRRVSR